MQLQLQPQLPLATPLPPSSLPQPRDASLFVRCRRALGRRRREESPESGRLHSLCLSRPSTALRRFFGYWLRACSSSDSNVRPRLNAGTDKPTMPLTERRNAPRRDRGCIADGAEDMRRERQRPECALCQTCATCFRGTTRATTTMAVTTTTPPPPPNSRKERHRHFSC